MKKLIFAGVISLLPFAFAQAAVFIKIDDIDGESTKSEPATLQINAVQVDTTQATPTPTRVATPEDPQESQTDAYLEIKGVEGESKETKGNVETEWKVEEGESASPRPQRITPKPTQGIEPDEIDFMGDGEPNASNFGILLSGGNDDSDEAEESRHELGHILLQGAQEEGAPIENISLNYEKVEAKVAQPVKFLGFIPLTVKATVEIDAEDRVKVRFPWWAIFASGKDSDGVGERTFTTLSNVLKSKHDTVKNSINNIR